MTENLPATRTQIDAGAPVAALVPRNIEEAFRLSTAIAKSGLAPKGIDKPEQIMVAIMAGAELGLAPFQSLQSFAVVNGRPTLWGDGLVAVVRAQGVRIREWIDGEGEAMVARCEVTRPDTGEVIPGEFSVADAKKAGLWNKQGPWTQYPRRMLKARARAFALRDGCADMLRGIQVREEVEDYVEIRPAAPVRSGLAERLAAPSQGTAGFSTEHVARETAGAIEGSASRVAEDEVQGATFSDEEVEAGAQAAQEIETDDFPGDAVTAARTGLPEGMKTGSDLLKEKQAAEAEDLPPETEESVRKLLARLDGAESMDALDEVWAASARFRDFLKANAPTRLLAVQQKYDERLEALS